MRLIDHLKSLEFSNKQARDYLGSGKVWVGGIPTRDGGREVQSDEVVIRMEAPKIRVGRGLVVLWRDNSMAVVWKPSGMLSAPAPKRDETNVLAEASRVLGAVLPVYRLGEETSGLMLVARTEQGQDQLRSLLKSQNVQQRYLAICQRGLPPDTTFIETNMVRDRGDGKRGTDRANPNAKYAATKVRTVEALGPCSLVEATLCTRNMHQIRIHLAEVGSPILGDALYGGAGVARRSSRLALHAWELSFTHPLTGAKLSFEAPLADDLEVLRRDLKVMKATKKRPITEGQEVETVGRKRRKKQSKPKSAKNNKKSKLRAKAKAARTKPKK
ncbi:MAG: hypothetical protein GWP91_11150 [Rhodobacterales bacterium]|nr:hypothetical protein [Rhodobacterales bacterium]